MVKLVLLSSAMLWSGAAMAQTGSPAPAERSDVTVRAPERLVCRPVVRTATRMRSARQCRRVSEAADAAQSQDEELARAADDLELLGEKVSTNCLGGMGGGGGGGPLGPRR